MVEGTREAALPPLPHLDFDLSSESDTVRFVRVCIVFLNLGVSADFNSFV